MSDLHHSEAQEGLSQQEVALFTSLLGAEAFQEMFSPELMIVKSKAKRCYLFRKCCEAGNEKCCAAAVIECEDKDIPGPIK